MFCYVAMAVFNGDALVLFDMENDELARNIILNHYRLTDKRPDFYYPHCS